jgi:O-antigen ligase
LSMQTSRSIRRTIIIGSTWLALATLFLAFNPAGLWQSVAAVLASGVVAVGAVALTWVDPRI